MKEKEDKKTTLNVTVEVWKFVKDNKMLGESVDTVLRRLLGLNNGNKSVID